jgi:PDZ domain-containing secreted protein
MALWKFSNLNKYGSLRSRILSTQGTEPFTYNKGYGPVVIVKRFKYDYTDPLLPPALIVLKGVKYIVPTWEKVHEDTRLEDINWIKPSPKNKKEDVESNVWKVESSSEKGVFYTVKKQGDKFVCNCSGFFRLKDKNKGCRHIIQIKNKI